MNATRRFVEMGDPKRLPGGTLLREAAAEEIPCDCEPVEFERQFDTLIPHRLTLAKVSGHAMGTASVSVFQNGERLGFRAVGEGKSATPPSQASK